MTKDFQSIRKDGDRLDSWKEVAAYLGKDVRTALRWSKDQGMPVYRHAASKHGGIYAYRSEIDEWIHSDRSASPRLHRKPVFLWIGAVFFLSLVTAASFLWINPSIDQPISTAAERTWVLITDFDNRSGEARFDGTVETALRRELANSRHALVVAPDRVRDTLALMKRAPDVTIDAELGREICLRYGGNCALLAGQVEKFGSSYLLSLEVVDPADGRTVASAEEEATEEAEILSAIHHLGNWLRGNLGEELAQISLTDQQFERVKTPSLRALELYTKGIQNGIRGRWDEAEALFRLAVEEDSEFASANLFVFWALNNQGKGFEEEARSFLEHAMKLAASASEQERYFIEGTYYDLYERDQEKACGSYKTLAELFPDHYWAAGNAYFVCGARLGHREDTVRYSVQAVEQRLDMTIIAATTLTLLVGDFDRARPYVEQMKGSITDGTVPKPLRAFAVAFTELFPAEEYLKKGSLPDVANELQRVELALGSMDASVQPWLSWKLANFYLALGQYRNAKALDQEYRPRALLDSWHAFLGRDLDAFQRHMEDFRAQIRERIPVPAEREIFFLGWNMGPGTVQMIFPLDVLVPLYDPGSYLEMASSTSETSPIFLSLPKFEAKLQLARGKQILAQGYPDEGIELLRRGVAWFRDNGDWTTFPYYFLGAELLAVTLAEQGDLKAAYQVLEIATGQKNLVNSFSATLHQKIQARQALLARELGRTTEAEAIEAELAEALRLADQDHPILIQIREQQHVDLETE